MGGLRHLEISHITVVLLSYMVFSCFSSGSTIAPALLRRAPHRPHFRRTTRGNRLPLVATGARERGDSQLHRVDVDEQRGRTVVARAARAQPPQLRRDVSTREQRVLLPGEGVHTGDV